MTHGPAFLFNLYVLSLGQIVSWDVHTHTHTHLEVVHVSKHVHTHTHTHTQRERHTWPPHQSPVEWQNCSHTPREESRSIKLGPAMPTQWQSETVGACTDCLRESVCVCVCVCVWLQTQVHCHGQSSSKAPSPLINFGGGEQLMWDLKHRHHGTQEMVRGQFEARGGAAKN